MGCLQLCVSKLIVGDAVSLIKVPGMRVYSGGGPWAGVLNFGEEFVDEFAY